MPFCGIIATFRRKLFIIILKIKLCSFLSKWTQFFIALNFLQFPKGEFCPALTICQIEWAARAVPPIFPNVPLPCPRRCFDQAYPVLDAITIMFSFCNLIRERCGRCQKNNKIVQENDSCDCWRRQRVSVAQHTRLAFYGIAQMHEKISFVEYMLKEEIAIDKLNKEIDKPKQ